MPIRTPAPLAPLLRRLRAQGDSLLARADLALVHRSNYEHWLRADARPDELPVELHSVDPKLTRDNPRLLDLARRYRGHPAAASSQWSDSFVDTEVNLNAFRADNAYVWQHRLGTGAVNYALTTYYLERYGAFPLFDTLVEDGLFGVAAFEVDGHVVSRDLLDSVTELSFLEEELGLSQLQRPTVLDIGAGYGRLAYRATTAIERVEYLCTDGVPLSSFLSEHYLRFRKADRAQVVPLDEIAAALDRRRVDVAVNVHSFSECPVVAITWWLDLLERSDVEHLMIVPNTEQLLSVERSGERIDFLSLIEARGFTLAVKRPKYVHSTSVQRHGIYPAQYYLFRRR